MLMNGEWLGNLVESKPLPNLHLEVSLGCNISCAMCTFHDGLKKFQIMPLEKLKKIKSGFENFSQVHIGDGSEPFINPDILNIVKYLYGLGTNVSVQTNAKRIRSYADAEAIVKSGLMLLSISVDGATDETVKKIRGGLGFSEIAQAIELINEAKYRLGSVRPYLACNAVAMRCNLTELPILTRYLLEHNFSSFRIGFLELRQPNKQLAGELLIYDMPLAEAMLEQVKNLIVSHPSPMHFDGDIFKSGVGFARRENCTGYKDRLYANYSGDIWTCYGKQRLGNIFDDGLDAVLNSTEYADYVQVVTQPGNTTCAQCSFCKIMSLDKITDHFGRRAIEYYGMPLIEDSLEYAKSGSDIRKFWQNQALN
ncbi:radical SAM protein [Methylomonas albis]|uniref:Radical SAM protein n=1 Tax=Methylomonas albis TaxID=1854563 RepID=A0ABR9CZD5_9GAMM|nr:radical SAM protein [Methylomonas albis]MBD9355057.1 radical SAM protein [Methylomonas albis]